MLLSAEEKLKNICDCYSAAKQEDESSEQLWGEE